MKPQVIFAAVFAVCISLVLLLPHVGQPGAAMASANVASYQATAQAQPTAQSLPATGAGAPVERTAVEPTAAPVIEQPEPVAAAQAPAEPLIPAPPEDIRETAEAVAASAGQVALTQELGAFVASVSDGRADAVTGVYAEGLFALPVYEQPAGDDNFISSVEPSATRYARPGYSGVIALLAHNYLSGRTWFKLRQGMEITLVYGDGRLAHYRVASVENYQAMSPHDVRSDFMDLNGPGGALLNYSQLYEQVYTRANTLVLQTCIEANGELSWGRMFVIAEPA